MRWWLFFLLVGFLSPAVGQSFSDQASAKSYEFDTTITNSGSAVMLSTRLVGDGLLRLTSRCKGRSQTVDTIYCNGLLYIKFLDFDGDGNADILVDYIGNNSTHYLYLFDPAEVKFQSIDGYMRFPDAVHLKADTKYYYSYHRAGCADENWVSDLFMISDYSIIHLGLIDGEGCSFEEEQNPPMIKIFKIKGNDADNAKLVEELPYRQYISDFGDKWGFIEDYWNKNLARFQ